MTGYVITAQGVTTILPAPVSWCFQYTSGVPCDSFRLRCIWDGDNQVRPEEWALFQALEGRYSSPEWWMSARPFWARREHFLR